MQPRQLNRHIFQLIFYPLLTTKGTIFKHFIDDLRQFPHMRLILVALFACLTTNEQIVQRIITLNTLDNILTLMFCFWIYRILYNGKLLKLSDHLCHKSKVQDGSWFFFRLETFTFTKIPKFLSFNIVNIFAYVNRSNMTAVFTTSWSFFISCINTLTTSMANCQDSIPIFLLHMQQIE